MDKNKINCELESYDKTKLKKCETREKNFLPTDKEIEEEKKAPKEEAK